jgi:hypothetical protein
MRKCTVIQVNSGQFFCRKFEPWWLFQDFFRRKVTISHFSVKFRANSKGRPHNFVVPQPAPPPKGGRFYQNWGALTPKGDGSNGFLWAALSDHFSPKPFARLALFELLSGFALSCKSFCISVTLIFVLTFLHKNHPLSSRVSKVVSSDFISHFKLVKSRLRPGRFLYGKLCLEVWPSTCSVFEAYTYK